MKGRIFAKDRWTTIDKLWHALGCMGLTVIWGEYTAAGFGILKEASDIGGSGASYKDLIADGIGICLGLLIRTHILGI